MVSIRSLLNRPHGPMVARLKWLLGKLETRMLVVLVALVGVPSLFLELADDVTEGDTDALDRRLLLALRSPGDPSDPLGPRWLEESMRDITALGGFTFLTIVTIVATLLLVFHERRRQALIFAATVILAYASSEVLKALYDRDRPALVAHGSIVYSQSFPSGHSTAAAATFLTLATVLASIEAKRRTKALIYGLAVTGVIAVGFSRVYLGVHWPTDVLAGWALGASWALAAWIVLAFSRPGRA
jgi:undecaprenyl-diphosphatase